MGGWYLEAFRMGVYIAFPVIAFYLFNQPQLFEEWVVKTKQETFPPDSKSHPPEIQKAIEDYQRQKREEMMRQFAEQANAKPAAGANPSGSA
jgi:protein PET100